MSLAELADGAFVEWESTPYLVWGKHLYPWTVAGYLTPMLRPTDIQVIV